MSVWDARPLFSQFNYLLDISAACFFMPDGAQE